MPAFSVRRHGTAVALLAAACSLKGGGAALTLRVAPRSLLAAEHGSDEAAHSSSKEARFSSLGSCSAAYEQLEEKCKDEHEGSLSHGWPWQSRGRLVDDEGGNRLIVKSVPMPSYSNVLYQPPTSYTGVPSSTKGWDYRHHGDDWTGLGQCGGPDQSPIDLRRHVDVKGLTKSVLWFDYYLDPDLNASHSAVLTNDGHGLRYQVGPNSVDFGFIKVGAEEYTAAEYLMHAPSEHTIEGAVFPVEMQVFNRAKSGGILAVAIFFREGKSNAFLGALMESMAGEGPRWTVKRGLGRGRVNGSLRAAFDLEALIPKGDAAVERAFFNYKGSLTQPPCTTGVEWWVLSSPITASREELRFVKAAIFGSRSSKHGNARATMPLGQRKVMAGLVGFQHAVKDRLFPGWAALDEAQQVRGYSAGDSPWGDHWPVELSADAQAKADRDEEEHEADYASDDDNEDARPRVSDSEPT